jgi:hypothetical protein
MHIDSRVGPAASQSPFVRAFQKREQAQHLGPPPLPLPPLDAPADKGYTIAAHGVASQLAAQAPPFPTQGPAQPPQPADRQGIKPGDVLPPAALHDPTYQPGNGAQFASNQPHLAAKYGVVRGGQQILPHELGLQAKGLRPQTIEDLNKLGQFVDTSHRAETGELAAEAAATPPVSSGPPRGEMKEAFEKLDALDYGMFRDMMVSDLLRSDEQRMIIEERLQPLDLSEYLMNGYVRQFIPIIPNKYEVEFKSLSVEEDLAVKRLVWTYHREHHQNLPEQFLQDLYAIMTNVAGLWAFNREQESEHLGPNGRFDDELFMAKFNRFWSRGFHLMVSMSVQYNWFDARVRKLFLAQRIKNG